jgi:hypothetical protein
MLSRVVVAAVVIFAVMVAVKHGVIRQAGLTPSCRIVQTAADGTEWAACKGGKLAGRPDLSSKSCTSSGVRGKLEYWHCPASVASHTGGV